MSIVLVQIIYGIDLRRNLYKTEMDNVRDPISKNTLLNGK